MKLRKILKGISKNVISFPPNWKNGSHSLILIFEIF